MPPGRSDRVRRDEATETRVGIECERDCTARGGGHATEAGSEFEAAWKNSDTTLTLKDL